MSRIERIETIRLAEHPRTLWVQVHTDDGLVGLGETYYVPGAVAAVIHDIAAPHLLGQTPFDLERAWTTLFQETNFTATPARRCAPSRRSTSPSGTSSARRAASRSTTCSAAGCATASAPTTPAPATATSATTRTSTSAPASWPRACWPRASRP